MIKLIKAETHRLFGNYKLLMVSLVLLLVNVALMIISCSVDDISSDEYVHIKSKLLSEMEFGDIEYTDSEAYKEIFDEYMSVLLYSDYVEKTIDNAKGYGDFSIFQNEFSINNSKKTLYDFTAMKNITPKFVGGYGMEKAISFASTDILLLLIIIIGINEVVIKDKKNEILSLTRATSNGSKKYAFAKITAVFSFATLFCFASYISNIVMGLIIYGDIDFSAPIQSLLDYSNCALKLNILEFLVINFIHRLFVCMIVVTVISLCAYVASNEVVLYIYIIFFIVTQLVVFSIGKTARLVFLCHLSLPHLLNPSEHFGYYNYNLFNNAVSSTIVDGIILLCAIVLLLLCSVYIFSRIDMEYKNIRLSKGRRRRHKVGNLFFIESEKIMLGYKVIGIVLFLCVLQLVAYGQKEKVENINEIFYRGYIKQIEGELTEEKINYINDEIAYMEDLKNQWYYWEQEYNAKNISSTKYEYEVERISKELDREIPLLRCKKYIDYLSQSDEANLEIIYDTGWNYLFGGANYKYDMNNAMLVVIAIIIGVSFMYVEDYKYNIQPIMKICKNYDRLKVVKRCIMHIYVGFVYIIVYLPELLWVYKNYGLTQSHANSASIMRLEYVGGNLSIFGYVCLVLLIRLIAYYLICIIMIGIGKKVRSTNITIIVSVVIFLLPLLLRTLGLEVFDKVALNSLLSGNYFLQNVL